MKILIYVAAGETLGTVRADFKEGHLETKERLGRLKNVILRDN